MTKKRRRSDDYSSRPAVGSFLSQFSAAHPIFLDVKPVHKSQQRILARNLRAAGATVYEGLGERIECVHATIITDCEERSRKLFQTDIPVSYAPIEWASAVLRDGRAYPVQNFAQEKGLDQRESFPPVWCTSKWRDADHRQKTAALRAMPMYACQRCAITTSIYASPNDHIVGILERIARKRLLEAPAGSQEAADIHARAYKRAAASLKCVPWALSSVNDVDGLPFFGPRVCAVIAEFFATGANQEVAALDEDERLRVLDMASRVYGIGFVTARRLFDKGVRDLDDVRAYMQSHRKTGLREIFMPDENECAQSETPLTYSDACQFLREVSTAANGSPSNLNLRFALCGGFRRGEPSGHDVDLVYSRNDVKRKNTNSVHRELVSALEHSGLVVRRLKEQSDVDGWGEAHYSKQPVKGIFPFGHDILHAVCTFRGKEFRADFVGVRDAAEFPFATLAWTGSITFQRDLRLYCEKRYNWVFNQHGLFDRDSQQRVRLDPYPATEHDIFNALDLTYRPPFERSS